MRKETKICSPCDKCPKQYDCIGSKSICGAWKAWFRDYWRRLRHMYGVDKVVKKDGK